MPSKKQYDLVSDDGYDSRIPLHNEEAFAHGIQFGAKYIGTLDVPRPSSRSEIVAAMRRIRYEFKAKAIKKKKVTLTVSVDGVKVILRKKKKKSQWHWDENRLLVMHHPIYRIFYVSHDSQDLKIWSYIARDGSTNVFKCNVFKAYKKNQAMRIVRTIGQAFEVCHKLSVQNAVNSSENTDDGSDQSDDPEQKTKCKDVSDKDIKRGYSAGSPASQKSSIPPTELALKQAQQLLQSLEANMPGGEMITSTLGSPVLLGDYAPNPELPLSSHHQMQLLRQQLEQQQQQTQVAIAQVHLLKDQLAAETAARIEAQARAHQLLLHNRDLLDHVSTLIMRVQDLEMKANGISSSSDVLFHTPPQIPVLPDPTTPQSGPVYLPEFHELDMSYLQNVPDSAMFENTKTDLDTDSPDSGHKEMSSDSLSCNLTHHENLPWQTTTASNGMKISSNKVQSSSKPSNDFNTPQGQERQPCNAQFLSAVSQGNSVYNPFSHNESVQSECSSKNHYNYNTTFKDNGEKEDKVKIITPLPLQDASGNRIDLNICSNTPKIEPPPKVQRSVRPVHMNLSNGNGNSSLHDANANIAPGSDTHNFSTCTGTCNAISSSSVLNSTPGSWASLCHEFTYGQELTPAQNQNHNISQKQIVIFAEKKDSTKLKVNDLIMQQEKTLVKPVIDTQLNIHVASPSDDESTENSEDSGIPPHNMPRRLDSMTFDEFDALSN